MRSKDELIDHLDQRRQRRKRELATLQARLVESKGDLSITFRRVAIVFAYAHWEGCVQDCATSYVKYATHKTRPIHSFITPFRALLLNSYFKTATPARKRIGPHLRLIEQIEDDRTDSSGIDVSNCIDTESNLTWEVFENICQSIGITDMTVWQESSRFMDDLFRNRCAIAHGEPYEPDSKFPGEALKFVLKVIDDFTTQVVNMTVRESFLKNSA
jgi:hypothetical protein